MSAAGLPRATFVVDPVARRDISLLRAKIAELEGRSLTPLMLPQCDRLAGIVTAVAAEIGVTREQLLGESRDADSVLARHAAMALSQRLLGYSLPRIGRLMQRDHSTVHSAIRRIGRLAAAQPDLAARLDRVANAITRQQQRTET
jgi:chromosomal replication initiation ATPase DnaA